MRSAVRICPAAPRKPVVPQGMTGFYFLFQRKTALKNRNKNRNGPQKDSRAGLSLPGFFYCIAEDLRGPAAAFLIGMGVHPQRYRRITVPQGFGHADHIGPGRDRHAGESMAQLVRMKARHIVSQDTFSLFTAPQILRYTHQHTRTMDRSITAKPHSVQLRYLLSGQDGVFIRHGWERYAGRLYDRAAMIFSMAA